MNRLADANAALSTLEQESLVQGRRPGIWACPREECGVESTMRHAIHHTDACPFSLIVTDQDHPSAAPGTAAAGQDQPRLSEDELRTALAISEGERRELRSIRQQQKRVIGMLQNQLRDERRQWRAQIDATRTDLAQARADVASLTMALQTELKIDEQEIRSRCEGMPERKVNWYVRESIRGKRLLKALVASHHQQPGASPADAPPLAAGDATIAAQALVLAEQRSAIQDAVRQGEKARFDNLDPAGAHRRALDGLRTLLATPQPAAVEQAAAVLEAGEAMADAIQRGTRELPRGGMTGGGDPPYSETWRMFRQSLDDYRRAVAALRGAGSGEAS